MNDKIFSLIHIAAHFVCILVSLYIIVPVSTHLSDFRGHCALFSCGQFIEDDGHFEPKWSTPFSCFYSIIIGGFTLLCSLAQLLLKLRLLYQNKEW